MTSSSPFNAAVTTQPIHPFANSKNLLVIIPDVAESRLYDELCDVRSSLIHSTRHESPSTCTLLQDQADHGSIPQAGPSSPRGSPSVFSKDIWLGDNSGESLAFARDVRISGWTSVGDKLGGAYIVYDCVIKTKEGTTIHAHKRYSAFSQLHSALRRSLPQYQLHFLPNLPPKSPLARFRPAFIDRRRQLLEYWLASVLLHPEIGGSRPVRLWIMD